MLFQAKLLMAGIAVGAAATVALVAKFDKHSKIANTIRRMSKERVSEDLFNDTCCECCDGDCANCTDSDVDMKVARTESEDNLPEEFYSDECSDAFDEAVPPCCECECCGQCVEEIDDEPAEDDEFDSDVPDELAEETDISAEKSDETVSDDAIAETDDAATDDNSEDKTETIEETVEQPVVKKRSRKK